jgi:hypothetical protein
MENQLLLNDSSPGKAISHEKKKGNSLIDQRNWAHAQNSISNAI